MDQIRLNFFQAALKVGQKAAVLARLPILIDEVLGCNRLNAVRQPAVGSAIRRNVPVQHFMSG
jgi:hypothetical protein